jgi:hypothetical protein
MGENCGNGAATDFRGVAALTAGCAAIGFLFLATAGYRKAQRCDRTDAQNAFQLKP